MDLTRPEGERAPVGNVELFFDLVYVFAVTQLSHTLLTHPTVAGAADTALLFTMVWLVWVYTTWVTNWLDPERLPVRALLLGLGAASLVMSAALPRAFGATGIAVGVAYAVMQVGRSAFAVWGLAGDPLQRNFQRILAWSVGSSTLAVAGGLVTGHARTGLWVGAVAVDLLGGAVGFRTPGLGRSTTADWQVEGGHFAERCQAFLLIAVGEGIVAIGATLSLLEHLTPAVVGGFVAVVAGSGLLWWLYFDRAADASAAVLVEADDPGALARSAYHLVHPFMVFGVLVVAAADELVLMHPLEPVDALTGATLLGGTGLFVAAHAAFKALTWQVWPRSRLVGLALVVALVPVAPHTSRVTLAALVAGAVLVVAVLDRRVPQVHPDGPHTGEPAYAATGG